MLHVPTSEDIALEWMRVTQDAMAQAGILNQLVLGLPPIVQSEFF